MPSISYKRLDLGYPPWTLDFDPYDRGYLVVGGGGGQNQKEVPNKLTLLDVSDPASITQVADLDVNDDSPSSLGLLATKDGLYALAGINSPQAEHSGVGNKHLRSFKAVFPKKAAGKITTAAVITALDQSQLFSKDYLVSKDAFQRLLRLSPAHVRQQGNKRIGVIANSLAHKSELVVFDATVATPTSNDVMARIEPPTNAEANDIDVLDVAAETFNLAYCTSKAVYSVAPSFDFANRRLKAKLAAPICLYEMQSKQCKIRSLRFVTENLILLLVNRSGTSELLLLKFDIRGGPGDIILKRGLSSKLGSAVSMDVSILDADPILRDRQVVIAVAAQKNDIAILTLDVPGKGNPGAIKSFLDLKDVHEASMKKVVFSTFHPPSAKNKEAADKFSAAKSPSTQPILRLASISLSNTIVVETMPLQELKTKTKGHRYILSNTSTMSRALSGATTLFSFAFILLSVVMLIQSYLDVQAAQGKMDQYHLIPLPVRQFMSSFRKDSDPVKKVIHDTIVADDSPVQRLADLLHLQKEDKDLHTDKRKAIVVRSDASNDDGLETALEQHKLADADPNTRRWDELSKVEQTSWKRKLMQAGQWSVEEGETVLKGIFFSEVAGVIARAAMGLA